MASHAQPARDGTPFALAAANTLHRTRGHTHDVVGTPADLERWFGRWVSEAGTRGERTVTEEDLAAFRQLREALRSLIAAAAAPEPASASAAAIARVNEVAAGTPVWPSLRVRDGGLERVERVDGRYGEAALTLIARNGIDLLAGPLAEKLRPCASSGCIQYFIATDPRRQCCSPACGNRARVARHYARAKSR